MTLAIILFFPMASKGQEIVAGTWIMDVNSVEKEMKTGDRETLSKLPNHKRTSVMDEIGSRTFTFSEDGSFRAEWIFRGMQEKMTGKWHMEGEELFIESNFGSKSYVVQVSNEQKLILIPNANTGFFQKLIFNKQELP